MEGTTVRRALGLAAVAIAVVSSTMISTSNAAVNGESGFGAVDDQNGANDVSGQKDLTQQGFDNASQTSWRIYWKWDDTTVSGKNTLDGCALFDNGTDGKVDSAICATVGNASGGLALKATSLYSCGNGRTDRCDNPVVALTKTAGQTYCNQPTAKAGPFDAADTYMECTIRLGDLPGGLKSLINTCSYSSSSPTSDPSDCVLVPGRIITTLSGSNVVYPNATISLGGWTAGGGTTGADNDLVFSLYKDDANCNATLPVYTQTIEVAAAGAQSTTNAAGGVSPYAITANGTYKWLITYAGNNVNLPSIISCGTIGFVVSSFTNS